jgi:hypothetical protein
MKSYETKNNGSRQLYKCKQCNKVFSETKGTLLEGLVKPISLIIQVLNARHEGMGVNAVHRLFKISKNTLLKWEKKFAGLQNTFFLYSLSFTFLSQLIEGDEFYTKVEKNKPIEDCEGWTVVLMERASRFIWSLKCGKKDRALFLHVINTLKRIIEQTKDLTLFTDGERRYGSILFEICNEVVKSGKVGRPPKILRKGVKVRIKNKGSQNRKRGRKRKKYETPHREHPDTVQNVTNNDIHANHVEAFNASQRRKHSACRRKTNTYAKKKSALQRVLDGYWIVHNFINEHVSTKQVPAVFLGIIERGLTWEEVLKVQYVV